MAEFSVQQTWQSDRRSALRWLWSHTARYKWYLLGILIGAFGNGMGAAALPAFVGWGFQTIIDTLPDPDYGQLGWIALLLIGSQLFRGAAMLGRNICSEFLGQQVERDARDELYLSLIGKSMSFHDSHTTGDLMARATNDVREINFLFNPGVNIAIGSSFFIIAPFIYVYNIHPDLLLALTLYVIFYIIALWNYLKELQPATEAQRGEFGNLNAVLAEGIDGIETVKGAVQEKREVNRFNEALYRWRKAFVRQGDVEARFFPLLLLGLLQAGALLHSLVLYQQGELSEGGVVTYNSMILLYGFPTFAAQFAYSRISVGVSSAKRVLDLINASADLDQNAAGFEGTMDGSIRFENVIFNYPIYETSSIAPTVIKPSQVNGNLPKGKLALEGVSFEVKPGQTVAITGQTGAGKSTVAKLVNRTYDVEQGRIMVSGVDVRDWNLEALRRQISIIEQDIYLFSRTIADNIAFGCPGATREAVIEAAQAAQAHEFITNFRDGYDTMIGERGVTLSGGQKQRLALARASSFWTMRPVPSTVLPKTASNRQLNGRRKVGRRF